MGQLQDDAIGDMFVRVTGVRETHFLKNISCVSFTAVVPLVVW